MSAAAQIPSGQLMPAGCAPTRSGASPPSSSTQRQGPFSDLAFSTRKQHACTCHQSKTLRCSDVSPYRRAWPSILELLTTGSQENTLQRLRCACTVTAADHRPAGAPSVTWRRRPTSKSLSPRPVLSLTRGLHQPRRGIWKNCRFR